MRDVLDPFSWWIGTPGGAQVFGNKHPIALDDTLVVAFDSGPTSVVVLANDFDPEGGPLTLVSAFAALGTAVAEADNTVTYTPPAGISGFDTVVYEIADDQDQRHSAQINVTISPFGQSLLIETEADNTLSVTADPGPLEITVTAPAIFAGTYPFDSADLAQGPVNLARPAISGTLSTGNVLTAENGLWVHDVTAGTPLRSYQWQRGGADIPGETAATYTVQAADLGPGVSLGETLTDAFGQRSAESALLTAGGAFLPSDDPLLRGWWDGSDTATITTTGTEVTAWADKSGGAPLAQNSPVRRPDSGTRTQNGLNIIDFDGSGSLDRAETVPASGNIAFHGVFVIDATSNAFEALLAMDATADFQLDANSASQFDGRLNSAGIGAPVNLTGGPFSGAFVLSILFDLGGGQAEVFISDTSRGQTSYQTPIDTSAALYLMTNRSQNAFVDGGVCELIITETLTNRPDYHAYLAAKWGVA